MIFSLVVSLILTIIIEAIVAILLKIRNEEDLKLIILINVCTNPIVVSFTNFSLLLHNDILYKYILIILELWTFFIEGHLLDRYLESKIIKPYVLSLCMNGISFGIGVVLKLILEVIV